jgi:DHA1 family bicyclomycin/chloramphenicol resistance-like MFS transporter
MLAALALAPMLAPLIGGVLLDRVGWHAIFATLALSGVAFFVLALLSLRETLPPERRAPMGSRHLARAVSQFLATPGTRLPTALGCVAFAGQFAYISDSPFVLMNGYGVPSDRYFLFFGATALALMLGSMLGGRLLHQRSPARLLGLGATLLGLGGVGVAVMTQARLLGPVGFIAPMIVYFVGLGLLGPSATALAMEPVPDIAGAASASIGLLSMGAGALTGWLTTRLGGSDPRVLGVVTAVMGLGAAALAVAAQRGQRA